MKTFTPEKLHGLSLTAAVQICSHPDIAVIVGGSEDRRNPIDMIQAIIEDTLTTGLDYTPLAIPEKLTVPQELKGKCWLCGKPKGQPPDCCPGHYDTENVDLNPLPIRCVCTHLQSDHFSILKGYGCRLCACGEFNSGYKDEVHHG